MNWRKKSLDEHSTYELPLLPPSFSWNLIHFRMFAKALISGWRAVDYIYINKMWKRISAWTLRQEVVDKYEPSCPPRTSKQINRNGNKHKITSFALPISSIHIGWERRDEMWDLQRRFGDFLKRVVLWAPLFPPRRKRGFPPLPHIRKEHLTGPLGNLVHSPL